MNEKIRKLAEHAELPNPHVPGQWRFNNQQLEFFTELIMRECAHVLMDKQNLSTNQYYQAGWHDAAIYLSSWSRNLDRGAPENGKLD